MCIYVSVRAVCMCVCAYVCMCVCVYVCMCVYQIWLYQKTDLRKCRLVFPCSVLPHSPHIHSLPSIHNFLLFHLTLTLIISLFLTQTTTQGVYLILKTFRTVTG